MPETGDKISVQCACGKKLKAPASAVGRKAKCPACGNVLTIEPPPPPEPEEDQLGALYDLADAEKDAARTNRVDDSPRCPQCAAEMAPDAVLCVNCGYDLRSKSKAAAKPVVTKPLVDLEAAKSSKKPRNKMAPEGKFIVGLALSAAFAAAAAGLWYVITSASGRDWYILSALIGIAAGFGMVLGQKGYSQLGGISAALVTMIVILVARVAMIYAVLMPELSGGHQSGLDIYDEHVVNMLVEQNLKAAGVDDPEDASDTQQERAEKAALAKLKGMSDGEYQAMVKQAKDKEEIDELVMFKTDEALQGKNPQNLGDALKMHNNAEKTARAQVVGMTPAQRQTELKRLRAAQADEEAKIQEEVAKNKSHSSGSGAGTAVAVGIVGLGILLFAIWPLLVMILAMSIAYKTAAGAVSG